MELAVCLPTLVFAIFGSIEGCNLIFLKQKLVEAAYEGALLGSQPTTSEAELVQHVQTILAARNITGATVSIDVSGPNFDTLPPGNRFTVQVDAATAGNIVGPITFSAFASINAQVVGHKQ